jgi:hypothetical protein
MMLTVLQQDHATKTARGPDAGPMMLIGAAAVPFRL